MFLLNPSICLEQLRYNRACIVPLDKFSFMKYQVGLAFFSLLFSGITTEAQKLKKADKQVIAALQGHVTYLSSDELEGRRAGSKGEEKAAAYIAGQFTSIGLSPKGSDGYFQPFDIYDGKDFHQQSFFFIHGQELKKDDFFPFANSPEGSLEAVPSIALREAGMPWFLNLNETIEQNSSNPHYDLQGFIDQAVKDAAAKKATALIVYNTGAKADQLSFDGKSKAPVYPIPVYYIRKAAADQYFKDETAPLEIKAKTGYTNRSRIGRNVIGYIDNGAAQTVVLGAHFDHLGYGEDHNSRYAGQDLQIHNGADDNASGTAALLEIARMLKKSKLNKANFLFIAFSAEELGLFGSKYFVDHPTIDLKQVDYMINMDMVGRLNDTSKTLTIGGIGTSPVWTKTLTSVPAYKNFVVKYDSSGTGPSDHTSFYRKDIPVLFFFTGLHTDYHKPSDDAPLINYVGQYRIAQYIYQIAEKQQGAPKLAFTKTRETQTTTSARFSVSMGIMPDYAFSGAGVRVDGVSEGKAAQKAGLQAGDIVTQLGAYPITSVEQYMQALSKFKKGDSTEVTVKRGGEEKKMAITF